VRNKDNDYLIDRPRQRTFNYSGLPGNRVEDAAMTESMGPIYERTRKYLGTGSSRSAGTRARPKLLQSLTALTSVENT
jgi:phthalate 4,5-dioxygenase